MSKISELVAERNDAEPFISFEYFPPKTQKGVENLYSRFTRMAQQEPLFIDVTWGAGGSTSDLTLELCVEAKKRNGLVPNMHLTCTNMEEEKIEIALNGAREAGIRNIVALRGDPPKGATEWKAVEGGFTCALDLVKHIRKMHGDYFHLTVAGYPEGHPNVIKPVKEGRELSEAEKGRLVMVDGVAHVCSDEDYKAELDYLKEKIDAGGDMIITQMFFDVDLFFTFVKDCREMGIDVPIIPGIMLLQNAGGFRRMTAFCKSRVPENIWRRLEEVEGDETKVKELGMDIGSEMCRKLQEGGVQGLHLYTLNLEKVTYGVMKRLGRYKETEDDTTESKPPVTAGTNQ